MPISAEMAANAITLRQDGDVHLGKKKKISKCGDFAMIGLWCCFNKLWWFSRITDLSLLCRFKRDLFIGSNVMVIDDR